MNENKNLASTTSTPKRRRLGLSKFVRLSQTSRKNKFLSPRHLQISASVRENSDSPPLPCNQVEYLCDSESNCSISSDIPCSPGVLETCNILDNIDNWKSFVDSKSSKEDITSLSTVKDVFEDSFHSKVESNLTSQCNHIDYCIPKKHNNYEKEIEHSFNVINESICNNDNNYVKEIENSFNVINESICNNGNLFDTKDSFLLDIKESGIVDDNFPFSELNQSKGKENKINSTFYGLPIITKGLFKTCRNIEKFYEWQEECLNLNAIKERRNLIYALPTSGGKTLVAEVLMLREVLVRKKNALFILPYVAIVQEKIWALSPFAIQLDFLVEEYAAGKGHLPPKKRRRKNSIYVATIEKGLALVRNLIELDRLHEIGLVVVDELHLIGEPGRGGTLETLLLTVIFANKGIQIVGMSATIGNLPDLANFLQADIYQREFRPVELTEYVKLGNVLHKIIWGPGGMELVPDRQLVFNYTEAGYKLDPDMVGGLVSEVVPKDSCLVFCPTKRNCQSVAALLCNMQRSEMSTHRTEERVALQEALRSEGSSADLLRCVRFGVAYHHAGLASDERCLLEQAFRSGVVSALCCTSTLAAGVNLPARRVVVRAPLVGREPLSLAAYRQMAGRAGRAGVCDAGESIIICGERDWPRLRAVLAGGLPPVRSQLRQCVAGLLLSAVALSLASDMRTLKDMLGHTLLAKTEESLDIDELCDENIRDMLKNGALEFVGNVGSTDDDLADKKDLKLAVSKLGKAAIKSCLELDVARQLLADVRLAARGAVLLDSLHLLYLVARGWGGAGGGGAGAGAGGASAGASGGVRPDRRHYYALYCALDAEGAHTARALGITDRDAVRMMTGKPISNVTEAVLNRFYVALMLRDLWRLQPVAAVAEKYNVPRGAVQAAMAASCAFAASAERLCEELEAPLALWTFRALFRELAARLRVCAAPELERLMELPAVRKARAAQLHRAGYRSVEAVARARPERLAAAVPRLPRAAAHHLVSAARMMLIEKVENLRAEAEDVMEELKI